MEELLLCPFCGGEPKWFDECSGIRTITWVIECQGCLAMSPSSTCKDDVREAWNRRKDSAASEVK